MTAVAAAALMLRGDIRVMAWNIWRGGNEAMDAKDPKVKAEKQDQIISVIRREDPDVVAMVETYGSGEVIAHGLRYHFQPRGTNVSLFSRWPIEKDVSVYKPFNCVGAVVRHPSGRRFAVYSVWIHYVDDVWTDPKSRDGRSALDLIRDDGATRVTEVKEIMKGIGEQVGTMPVFMAGDFNSNSHLDYTEAAKGQFGGFAVEWPVTKTVADDGWADSYREVHPSVNRRRDRTWSPRFPEQIQDRIDYIFYKGGVRPQASKVIDRAGGQWPSDHAAVVTEFGWTSAP